MRGNCALDFRENGPGEALVADQHDRDEGMGARPERATLRRR
jgi:hypothetical protein